MKKRSNQKTKSKPGSDKLVWFSRRRFIIENRNSRMEHRYRCIHMPVWVMACWAVAILVVGMCIGAAYISSITDDTATALFYLGREGLLEQQLKSQKQDTYNCLALLANAQQMDSCSARSNEPSGMPYVIIPGTKKQTEVAS